LTSEVHHLSGLYDTKHANNVTMCIYSLQLLHSALIVCINRRRLTSSEIPCTNMLSKIF